MLKKVLLSLLIAAVAFAAGIYVGYRWIRQPELGMMALGQAFMSEQHAMIQYREASYAEAQQALSSHISYLNSLKPYSESWQPGESPILDERGLRVDKVLAWTRLALLHERNQNAEAADAAWKNAESLARQGSFKDPSRTRLKELVRRLDESRK